MGLRLGIIASSRSSAPSAALLLDTYTGAAAAYSVRKLRSAYTGYCMQIRRSSDSAYLDVGFNGSGLVDTTAITSFVGSNSAIVYKWYDQTGNGRDAISSLSEPTPKIVVSGVLQTLESLPTIKFVQVSGCGFRTLYNLVSPFSIIGVLAQDAGFNLSSRIFSADNTQNFITIGRVNVTSIYTDGDVVNFPSKILSQTYLISFMRQSTSNYVYQNGTIVPNTSTRSNNWGAFSINSGLGQANEPVDCRVSEVILYPNNQVSNITGINSNINSYYTIY